MRKSILTLAIVFVIKSQGIEIFLKDGNIFIKNANSEKVVTPKDLRLESITNLTINDYFYNPRHGSTTYIKISTDNEYKIIFQVNEEGVISEGYQYSSSEKNTTSSIAEHNVFSGACRHPSNRKEETLSLSTRDRYKKVRTIKATTFTCSCCQKKKTSRNSFKADEEIICNACYGEKISKE
ncbi:hypothetical protein [Endozoicomonas sp. 4G]|uniref:hypothetical protein n=1 Tax=Endozoicomonas sp. 4G TaxID=2872754 RepID=UPI0020788A59|nr:hypothetical protein [Endozoicomonas sp. 4G]